MSALDKVKTGSRNEGVRLQGKDPETNIQRFWTLCQSWIHPVLSEDPYRRYQRNFQDPDNGTHKLCPLRYSQKTDPEQLRKVYEELMVNSMLLSAPVRSKGPRRARLHNVPWPS